MRASDPAGYEGMEKLVAVSNPTAIGRAVFVSTGTAGSVTLDIETNEVSSVTRDYDAGTTTVSKTTVTGVIINVPANSSFILPIVGKITLSAATNAVAYVLR